MRELLSQKKQFIYYCLIGGCGTIVTCSCYALLVQMVQLHYQVANLIGYAAGTLISFILNARYNFCVRDRVFRRLAFFFLVAGIGWIASAGLLSLLVGQLRLNALVAYVIVIGVVLLLQYNLNRFVSFRKLA